MSFARQKRLLLGWIALLAPVPLPFNGVVDWPAVLLYMAGVAFFLRRASLDPPRWLPPWGMNVLGLAYLPLFFLDLFGLAHGLVRPVLHLCMFALLVKLFAIVRERDKWQASIGVFFLFLAAMGTSVHPTIVLYLIGFLVLALVLLTRFAFLHVLSGFGREDPALAAHPPARLPAADHGHHRGRSPCRCSCSCRACARRSSSAAAAAAASPWRRPASPIR